MCCHTYLELKNNLWVIYLSHYNQFWLCSFGARAGIVVHIIELGSSDFEFHNFVNRKTN